MSEKENKKPAPAFRRYGIPLTAEDVKALGFNPDESTASIRTQVREKMGLPVVKTERQALLDKLGLPSTATAKETRQAMLKKLE